MFDELGNRMKKFYEEIPKTRLMRRTPVIIRLDGKAFHTFTRGFKTPFDGVLNQSMRDTMEYLCKNIQGCVLGYTQSDEITLVLCDYQTLDTSAWFDYEIQKLCSVSASMATLAFNKALIRNINLYVTYEAIHKEDNDDKYLLTLKHAINKGAMFDSRCFNIPKEEVANLLYWRQSDCMRNSVSMVGRCYFSDKELYKKSTNDIINMLAEKGYNYFEDTPLHYQRGSCCVKFNAEDNEQLKTNWIVDLEIPVFKKDGREYIEKRIRFDK